MKGYSYSYESLADAADAAEMRNAGPGGHSHGRPEMVGDATDKWAFGVSFDGALEMARHGWHEQLDVTLAITESAIEMAEQEHLTDTFAPVWDVTGAEVDVARYLSGEPECMIDFPLSKTSKAGRVITLVASVDWSASVSADSILKRGRLIVALALALTRLGHSVEMYVNANGLCRGNPSGKYGKCELSVKVKGTDDEIDPAAIMFAYAHPAMLRRVLFGIREKSCPAGHVPMGPSVSLYPDGTIFLPEIRSDHDVPDADQFLRKYLGELGLLAE
jgi:hypothetical protein